MSKIEKYPKDFQEFLFQFRSDDDCWDYLFEIRWPNGFVCPICGGKDYCLTGRKLLHFHHPNRSIIPDFSICQKAI